MTIIKNDYLKIGSDAATLKLEAFINLSCPGSKAFYEVYKESLVSYVEAEKLQIILKLYDKPREELLHGTLIHLGLHYDRPEETLKIIADLLETQETWLHSNDAEIKNLLVTKYGLPQEEIEANTEISLAFTLEAIQRNVKIVPNIFINGNQKQFTFQNFRAEVVQFVEEELLAAK